MRACTCLAVLLSAFILPVATHAGELSEIPAKFTVPDHADFTTREVAIPMRDGAKLFTVIIIPRGAHRAPILLTRTPYDAKKRGTDATSAHLGATLGSSDVGDELMLTDGYIRVFQDVRGKYHSEGDYIMNRPLVGPLNPTKVDHATDTYDTIDWLVKNIPESNSKVGITGISYDGFTSLMALVNPHPALKAAVPINPMVDGWMGDDWFHKGAFRQDGTLQYIYEQESTRGDDLTWALDHYDSYSAFLETGSAGAMAHKYGLEQLGFWKKLSAHPAYDSFWQQQAMDKVLAAHKLTVPTMLVDSLWDQEDIYGATAVYNALLPQNTDGKTLFLTIGPWYHHQQRLNGTSIGAIDFGQDTAAYFRHNILRPFLNHFLKDNAPPLDIAPVNAFETGTNNWRKMHSWSPSLSKGPKRLYLANQGGLGFAPTPEGGNGYTEYVSDPAHPVPYRPRPVATVEPAASDEWHAWLVSDQRNVESRPDVVTYQTPALTNPIRVAGQPVANIVAAISGSDVDFVVKLIDVYPDEVGRDPKMGGYELMVSADILRGRYRQSFSDPSPVPSGEKQTYKFTLPNVNHVFLPGHKIMVQIQSSWFPLYDRNPQTYVDNIMFAKPEDYHAQTIKIFDAGKEASFVDVPALPVLAP